MRRRSAIVLLCLAAVLAACGGDKPRAQAPAQGRLSAPIDPDGPGGQPARSNETNTKPVARDGAAGVGNVTNPCRLVSRVQASALAGEAMLEPIEAPQGPTCIYRFKSRKRPVTLALESVNLQAVRRQLHARGTVQVGGRSGFCTTQAEPVLYMPIGRGAAVVVATRCDLARRFAARALQQLGA